MRLSVWDLVVNGKTVTLPKSVDVFDRIKTGRRFQNSGSCASLGRLHQYTCRIRGADLILDGTRGGSVSLVMLICPSLEKFNVLLHLSLALLFPIRVVNYKQVIPRAV